MNPTFSLVSSSNFESLCSNVAVNLRTIPLSTYPSSSTCDTARVFLTWMEITALPQRIGDAHLADQPANFQRHRRSAASASRFPAPVRSETGTMINLEKSANSFPYRSVNRDELCQRIAKIRGVGPKTVSHRCCDLVEAELRVGPPSRRLAWTCRD